MAIYTIKSPSGATHKYSKKPEHWGSMVGKKTVRSGGWTEKEARSISRAGSGSAGARQRAEESLGRGGWGVTYEKTGVRGEPKIPAEMVPPKATPEEIAAMANLIGRGRVSLASQEFLRLSPESQELVRTGIALKRRTPTPPERRALASYIERGLYLGEPERITEPASFEFPTELEIRQYPSIFQPIVRPAITAARPAIVEAEIGFEKRYAKALARAELYEGPVKDIRKLLTYGAGGAVSAIIGAPRFAYQVVTAPQEIPGQFFEELQKRPVQTTVELIGGALLLGKAGIRVPKKVTAVIPKVKYGKVQIPKGKPYLQPIEYPVVKGKRIVYKTAKVPVEPTYDVVYKGLFGEIGRKAQPLIGKTKEGYVLGLPTAEKLGLKGFKLEGYVPITPLETKVLARESVFRELGFEKPAVAAEKVSTFTDIMGMFERQRSAFVEKELPSRIESLSAAGVKETLKYTRQSRLGHKFYGSFTMYPQLLKGLRRIPADIDLFLKTGNLAVASEFTGALVKRLRGKGERVRISKQSPTLIESKVKGKWRHSVDIHYAGETPDLLSPAAVGAYGFMFEQKPLKIGKTPIMRLSESGLRKGAASLIYQKTRLFPETHRLKDVPDFYSVYKTLIESAKKGPLASLRYRKVKRGEVLVERARELFPEIDFEKFLGGGITVEVPLRKPPRYPTSSIERIIGDRPSPIPSRAPKPSRYPSLIPSKPPSVSPYISPYISPYVSPYISPYISPSISPRPSGYPSLAPSKPPSVSPYISPYISPYVSPYISPYISPSISPYVSPKPPSKPPSRPPSIPLVPIRKMVPARYRKVKKPKRVRRPIYKPSLIAVISGITAEKPPKRVTGIGIRPIVARTVKKRRLM